MQKIILILNDRNKPASLPDSIFVEADDDAIKKIKVGLSTIMVKEIPTQRIIVMPAENIFMAIFQNEEAVDAEFTEVNEAPPSA